MGRPKKPVFSFDFESIVDETETRVWLWGSVRLDNEAFEYGPDLDSFMNRYNKIESIGYFHNLKFDIQFIFYWLFHNGYTHTSQKIPGVGKFSTLISDMGAFYNVKIHFFEGGVMTLYDSLKIITMRVEQMPKAFGLDIEKLSIEYEAVRDINHVPTDEEIKYVHHDCLIVARALKSVKANGLTKMTAASNAMNQFRKGFETNEWQTLFPQISIDCDKDCRKSYKGGWSYLNPKYKDEMLGTGQVYDVNSMYPWAMRDCMLPWGDPVYYRGKYEEDEQFPLFIQCLRCSFKLKPGMYPSIQLKGNFRFVETEYISDTNGDRPLLYLTSVDYKLFIDLYDIEDVEYIGGYKFRGANGMFTDYINYWYEKKAEYKHEGNMPMYYIAKLMLNSLYGKFGSNPEKRSKYPVLDEEDDIVRYELSGVETGKTAYVPVASFITSYCRDKIIRTAIACGDKFVYADTDSVHIIGDEVPNIDIDDYRLGAFKCESKFDMAKFHRSKCYIEQIEGRLEKKCAGLPDKSKEQFTFETMEVGSEFTGKLVPKNVKGGVVLVDRIFTIK